MTTHTVCDTCGAVKWDDPFCLAPWAHDYDTGQDLCPRCLDQRMSDDIKRVFDKARSDMGLARKGEV